MIFRTRLNRSIPPTNSAPQTAPHRACRCTPAQHFACPLIGSAAEELQTELAHERTFPASGIRQYRDPEAIPAIRSMASAVIGGRLDCFGAKRPPASSADVRQRPLRSSRFIQARYVHDPDPPVDANADYTTIKRRWTDEVAKTINEPAILISSEPARLAYYRLPARAAHAGVPQHLAAGLPGRGRSPCRAPRTAPAAAGAEPQHRSR